MTHPGGGQPNTINLATLWIPVMPETSHIGEEMEKSGKESKRRWEQGFNSGASPESMGSNFGSKLHDSISKEFKNFELPFGASGFFDKFAVEVDRSASKLKGEASQALQAYRGEYDKLTEAQTRSAEADRKVNLARDQGFNKATIMLPLISEQTAAHNNLTQAHGRAAAALDNYNVANGKLSSTFTEVAGGGKVVAAVMGSAIVLGAQLAAHAVEAFAEAVAEGFEKSIELTIELAKQAIELGEKYEHIGIQIHEFSTAAGEDFEKMEASAQHVFSTLDVAGNDVGKTMAQLSSMMDVPGEHIQGLVRNVTELQGRFTTLKATDLGSIFLAFKTPAQEADSALASLLQSARGSGQDLGQLASTLSGNVAITLHEAGLNLEQAGAFTANLMKMGEPGRQAMVGMTMAMKEFGKEGLSFSDGMKLAGEKLNELGDTAEGQHLAETLFGTRNWIIAKDAVSNYLDIINQAPTAFSATTTSTQEFLDQTADLGNKIEEFKHKAEDAFKPFGDAAKNAAINGLNTISNWFDEHRVDIVSHIKSWGDTVIDLLPKFQEFSVIALRIFGYLANGLMVLLLPLVNQLSIGGAAMLALTGHFKEAGDLLKANAQLDAAALTGKIATTVSDFADKIQGLKIDSEAIRDAWDGAADAASTMPTTVGTGINSQTGAFAPRGTPTGAGTDAGAFPTPVAGAPTGAPTGGGGAGPFAGPYGSGGGGNANKQLAQQMFPWPASEWQAFDNLEMKEAGYDATAHNASGAYGMGQFMPYTWPKYGAKTDDPATQLQYMFAYIKDRYGTPSAAWAQYYQHPHGEGSYATGGPVGFKLDPSWANPWDPGYIDPSTVGQDPYYRMNHPGAQGGWRPGDLQPSSPNWHMPGGFSHFAVGGPVPLDWAGNQAINPANPIQPNMYGSINEYLEAVNLASHLGYLMQNAPGHAVGGPIPLDWAGSQAIDPANPIQPNMYANINEYIMAVNLANYLGAMMQHAPGHQTGMFVTGGNGGIDDIPARLTAGEYVWDTKTVDKYGWLISGLHRGFQGGGPVDDVVGTNANIQGIDEIAKGFQLQLTAGQSGHGTHEIDGGYHDSGSAGDFSNGDGNTDQMLAFAMYMFEHYGSSLSELIYSDPRMTKLIKDGRVVDPSFYGADTLAGHRNHVHVAAQASTVMSDMSPGSEQLNQGLTMPMFPGGPGSTPGGKTGANFPGMPGQYGGYGAYGGETADQRRAAEKAVQEANDRAGALDHQVQQNQKQIDDLKAQIADIDKGTLGPLGRPVKLTPDEQKTADDKRKRLSDQLDEATYQLGVSQRERSEQDANISDAERKQREAMYKKPGGASGTQKVPGQSEFSQLGSSLLGGIGQELGFGDLFGKPPWEWGAVKLLTGAASWAMGTANAWADEIGKGHTGMTNFQPIEGWDQPQGGGASGLLSGVAGSLGINLPTPKGPSISAGPNMVAPQALPPGQGSGPMSNVPGVVNYDQSIHVQAGVDPAQILGPVQEQQNAYNANSHTFTGGLPQ